MRAERRQFAAKFEAEGDREASRIRSEADLEAARIRAKGAEEEARIRGESAAQVAKTYADAHRIDPELYRFTRSLDSLDKLVTGSTSLILRTDSEPFSLLENKEQNRETVGTTFGDRPARGARRPRAGCGVAAHALVGGAMAVLYALSGITIVKPDEVAVILRWGRLVGDTPALQEHGPGLLFAFPRPVDQVVRVQVKHVWEAAGQHPAPASKPIGDDTDSFDPLTQGYALTGDQNIVHVEMVARYRVRDPAEWAFYGPKTDDVLRVEVTAAMVRSLGEMGVDRVLADGRKGLIATATRRAQAGLDAAHSGLELSSLELTSLTPPAALARDFDAVQSAFIGAETKKKDAQAYAESAIPQAQAKAD